MIGEDHISIAQVPRIQRENPAVDGSVLMLETRSGFAPALQKRTLEHQDTTRTTATTFPLSTSRLLPHIRLPKEAIVQAPDFPPTETQPRQSTERQQLGHQSPPCLVIVPTHPIKRFLMPGVLMPRLFHRLAEDNSKPHAVTQCWVAV